MKALMIAAAVMLGGCAGGYYSDIPPTPATVEAAGGVQIYKGTAYLPSDFKPSGELRAFGDYDFMVESAPCDKLPMYRPGAVAKEKIYEIVAARGLREYRLLFHCRDVGRSYAANTFRLFLLTSKADCDSRLWDMAKSSNNLYRTLGRYCEPTLRPETLEAVDRVYRKDPAFFMYF